MYWISKILVQKKVTITSISDNNTNPYITYSYDDHTNEEIAAGGSLLLKVKVTYANEVTDLSNRAQNTAMKISINYRTEEWGFWHSRFRDDGTRYWCKYFGKYINGSDNPAQ